MVNLYISCDNSASVIISDKICVSDSIRESGVYIESLCPKVSLMSVHPPVQHYGGGDSAAAQAAAAASLPAEMEIERSFVFR